MRSLFKFWISIIAFSGLLLGVAKLVYSLEPLTENSIAQQKKVPPPGNLTHLFDQLGINFANHDRLNPCHEIEELTLKYCTPQSLKVLLTEYSFVYSEDELYKKFLLGKNPCQKLAAHVGSVCYVKNFKKILQYNAVIKQEK